MIFWVIYAAIAIFVFVFLMVDGTSGMLQKPHHALFYSIFWFATLIYILSHRR